MSQNISFPTSTTSGTNCRKITAPVVYQGALDISIGTGSTAQNLLATISSGSPAAFGGQIINKGCNALEATITYLQGDDCDTCATTNTITTVDVTVIVPKNSNFPIPDGFLSSISVIALDSVGAPVNVESVQNVDFYSAYQKCCNEDILVP